MDKIIRSVYVNGTFSQYSVWDYNLDGDVNGADKIFGLGIMVFFRLWKGKVRCSSYFQRSAQETAFDKVTHKRCVNCHPAGNAPLQGEESHLPTICSKECVIY